MSAGESALDAAWAIAWITAAAAAMADERVELNGLDREIGDGDHGENLDRGFRAVLGAIDTAAPATPGTVLRLVATTLISTVGGASGPLLGTAFLRGSAAAGGAATLDAEALAAVIRAAATGVAERGRAAVGDKTMLDAWAPAAAAAETTAAAAGSPAGVLRAAADAAHDGAHATVPLTAHRGRASYLGDRAVGHADPGAVSTALLLTAAAETAEERA